MERITRQATKRTPFVDLNFPDGRLVISGEAYPEDAAAFFGPLVQAMREFLASGTTDVTVDIALLYFNSSATKALMVIFRLLEQTAARGRLVTVNWIHRPHDEAMAEFGEDFAQDFSYAKFVLVRRDAADVA